MSGRVEASGPLGYVGGALLDPSRRPGLLRGALGAFVRGGKVAGAALLRPGTDEPFFVEYAGERREEMGRWLSSRLGLPAGDLRLELVAGAAPPSPHPPVVLDLRPPPPAPGGLLVLWPREEAGRAVLEEAEGFRRGLETLLEVEWGERAFFGGALDPLGPELSRAVAEGDEGALSALLALARTASGADLAYWGDVSGDALNVRWHHGARSPGFGFELPVGQGVGGRALARAQTLDVADYLNCQFRYPGVSDITDGEGARSTVAIPVRAAGDPAGGAVLYAVRRNVAPFTEAQKALLTRLKRSVEAGPGPAPGVRLPILREDDGGIGRKKASLREILLRSSQVREVEAWLEGAVGGPATVVDGRGHPYWLQKTERLERLRASGRPPRRVPVPGTSDGAAAEIELWPTTPLPPAGWPDLLEDAAAACAVVIGRAEAARERTDGGRGRWMHALMEGPATGALRREGDRLGLPTDRGEVWAVGFEPGTFEGSPGGSRGARLRMLAEDVVLDRLKVPLTFLGETGVLLLRGSAPEGPERVRDALLRYFGPAPVWLAHGSGYGSFEGLRDALRGAVSAVEGARREGDSGRYVLRVGGEDGLDGLLENPKLGDELAAFARSTLAPLLDYDAKKNARLTETFCHALALGSTAEAARALFVHENTVRYRMRRAESLLGKSLSSPKERTAMTLAAFVWLRHRAS